MTIADYSPSEITTAASALTATGIAPEFVLTDESADVILAYCQTVTTSAQWTAADVGVWKRKQLRRLHGQTATYNERVNQLYEELSHHCPTVASAQSWRSYLSVAESVPYSMRVIGYGPSVYIPLLSYPPQVQAAFVQAVIDGHHTDFQRQLFQRNGNGNGNSHTNGHTNGHATYIAPTEDDDDYESDVPFSGSGYNYSPQAQNAIREYESCNDDLPTLSWQAVNDVRALRDYALEFGDEQARELAGKLRWL